MNDRTETAPLHKRLEAAHQWVRAISLGRSWSIVRPHIDALREAAAALRPPEGKVGALHERLEALLVRDSTGREITPVFVPAATLREAAAALRPPEGDVGLLCGRLEADAWIEDEKGEVSFARRIRTALAHLRRLAAVEAERDALRAVLEDIPLPDTMKDAADHYRRFYDWLLGPVRRALAPAPAAEGE